MPGNAAIHCPSCPLSAVGPKSVVRIRHDETKGPTKQRVETSIREFEPQQMNRRGLNNRGKRRHNRLATQKAGPRFDNRRSASEDRPADA